MAGLQASAPGKLVIAGEYAVLEGGPAVATAVDRRAAAKLISAAERNELCIANTNESYGFEITANRIDWQRDPGEQGVLLEAAVSVFGGEALAQLQPLQIELCSQEFYAGGTKQGLGSSAALAVALSGCLQRALNRPTDVDTALALHREFQQGSGSGIDVQTSYHGGAIAVNDGEVRQLNWPEAVHVLPVWTGVAASTLAMLQKLQAYAAAEPQAYADLQADLSARSAAVQLCCEAGDTDALLTALAAFSEGLQLFDQSCELGIWSAEHQQLASLADDSGVIYKPSGAGGGDFGLAFSTDSSQLALFRQAVGSAGYVCGEFSVGADGLKVK